MNIDSIKSINDLKRDVLEDFIKSLPNEDKINLKKFVQERRPTNAAGVFTTVRAYIFNRKTPIKEKRSTSFAETLDSLLELNEEDSNE